MVKIEKFGSRTRRGLREVWSGTHVERFRGSKAPRPRVIEVPYGLSKYLAHDVQLQWASLPAERIDLPAEDYDTLYDIAGVRGCIEDMGYTAHIQPSFLLYIVQGIIRQFGGTITVLQHNSDPEHFTQVGPDMINYSTQD